MAKGENKTEAHESTIPKELVLNSPEGAAATASESEKRFLSTVLPITFKNMTQEEA